MNLEYFLLFTIIITLLLLLIQRTESGKRRIVIFTMIIPAILIRNWANYRDMETEAWAALATAILLNALFWLVIGRYNPVPSSEDIRVLGLDD